jgi:hypothetical protein
VRRLPTLAVVLLALAGVVTGNLYRPCQCKADEVEGLEARCCGRTAAPDLPPCCRPDAPERGPSDGDEGCGICCKPRAPLDEPDASPAWHETSTPTLESVDLVVAVRVPSESTLAPIASRERRTIDPWLLSPEGLTVFLI